METERKGIMVARQEGVTRQEKTALSPSRSLLPESAAPRPSLLSAIFWALILVVAIVVVGGGIPATFWGIWSIFAPIPKFFGYSRFWQDVIAGIIWAVIIGVHISEIDDVRDELSHDGEFYVSFADVFWWSPPLVVVSAIGAVIFIADMLFSSLAMGLVCYVAMWFVILIGWLIYKVISSLISGIGEFFAVLAFGRANDSETDDQ